MNDQSVLGAQIAAYRKAAGMTQEELGKAAGVSTQAVSRWECGGAPDVALLPAIADRLGVSVDALFGRGEGTPRDMSRQLNLWLQTIPKGDRLGQLFRLLSAAQLSVHLDPKCIPNEMKTVAENCYAAGVVSDSTTAWFRSRFVTEEGMMLSVVAENFPLYLLLPEPPEGYEAHFTGNEDYRRLFSLLASGHVLEILRCLYGQKSSYYTAAAVAKRAGLTPEEVERDLEAMCACNLVHRRTLELEDSAVEAYTIHDNQALVPFLYFARWLMEKHDAWYYGWETRERPILAPPEKQKQRKGEGDRDKRA